MEIDPKTLMESASDDREFASELLEMFMEQARSGFQEILISARASDSDAAAEMAHKMVGSCLACGFLELGEALRDLELRCRQGEPVDVLAHVDRMMVALEEAHVKMVDHLHNFSS